MTSNLEKVKFFKSAALFRKWLEKNHKTKKELIVGFHKVNSGKQSLTWSESVDQALCFGWIDSVRRSIDDESYCIRFTPRRLNSVWSDVNLKKVDELIKTGEMTEAGLELYKNRKKSDPSKKVTQANLQLSNELTLLLRKSKIASDFLSKQTPSFKKKIIDWVMSAKQKQTQLKRLTEFVSDCERNKNKRSNN
ncbi:MAG: YdeI/OmpD-associated family protein [Sphingobacteriaceae bacterium]|jgi:uncharacterized protein YdeI (YjbR/CyaY-like superfamily)